jgi:hypothetical protein
VVVYSSSRVMELRCHGSVSMWTRHRTRVEWCRAPLKLALYTGATTWCRGGVCFMPGAFGRTDVTFPVEINTINLWRHDQIDPTVLCYWSVPHLFRIIHTTSYTHFVIFLNIYYCV